tara:strand:+ start:45 stop:278 length:234 start_codon:yes stop_codon:yes gene_type:complete
MEKIYWKIISEGVNGVADDCGDNNKGQNLAFVAEIEIYNQLKLFPEMLEMLKRVADGKESIPRKEVRELITKAQGGK